MLYFVYPPEPNSYFFRLQLMDCIGDWRKFYTELVCFLLLFWWQKIACKGPFDQYFHPFITEFFRFAYLQFKIKEKIHDKAVMLLMSLEVPREAFFSFLVNTKVSQNSQKFFFNKVGETLAQVFSCEFWKISKNTFF